MNKLVALVIAVFSTLTLIAWESESANPDRIHGGFNIGTFLRLPGFKF